MWQIKPEDRQDLNFELMEPIEVLYEFDSALIFTFKKSERWFFAYLSDEDVAGRSIRYLVVATDEQEIANLKFGKLSVFDVLNKYYVWAVDRSFEDEFLRQVCLRGLAVVPDSNKPLPSAMLYAHLRRNEIFTKNEVQRVQNTRENYFVHKAASFDAFSAGWHEPSGNDVHVTDSLLDTKQMSVLIGSLAERVRELSKFSEGFDHMKVPHSGEGNLMKLATVGGAEFLRMRVIGELHAYSSVDMAADYSSPRFCLSARRGLND